MSTNSSDSIPPASNDAELAAAARKESPAGRQAFAILVERHHGRIVRLVSFLLSGSSDADDVAQEVFVRAYFALGQYTERGDFGAWLRVIATRVAFNHRRDEATRRRYQAMVEPRQSKPSTIAERDAITHALAQLPYPAREILILRYVEELSIAEIAHLLELGTSATKMRLSRARDQLSEVYGEEFLLAEDERS